MENVDGRIFGEGTVGVGKESGKVINIFSIEEYSEKERKTVGKESGKVMNIPSRLRNIPRNGRLVGKESGEVINNYIPRRNGKTVGKESGEVLLLNWGIILNNLFLF